MLPELLQLLIDRAVLTPAKTAFIFIEDSGKPSTLTYEELYIRSSTLARNLHQDKSSGSRALLIYSPGFDFIIALFACFLSGATAIPIAIPKPRTKELFQHFLDHARPHFILTTTNLENRIKKLLSEDLANHFITTDSITRTDDGYIQQTIANETALIQYTSGTTTQPKGVKISFENLHHNLNAIQQHFNLNDKSICFSWLPHHHDMGLVDGILTPVFNGCLGILCSPLYVISNPTRWLKVINDYRVTHTGGPNFFFELCTERILSTSLQESDFRSLTHVYVSAEPVRKKTLEKFSTFFAPTGFHPNLFTPGYGLAEATLMVTCKNLNSPLHYFPKAGQEYIGLGKPVPGMTIKIIDPTTLQETSAGETGEICLHGTSITSGYYEDDKKTSNAFISLSTDRGQHYFRTGDTGFMEAGELCVIGRLTDTILIRGLKYPPEDLEYIITQSHPALSAMACAVFTIPLNEEEKIVVLQELKKGMDSPQQQLEIRNSVLNSVYQAFGLTVFDITLLPQESIRKTTSGKIKRNENRIKYLQGEFSKRV